MNEQTLPAVVGPVEPTVRRPDAWVVCGDAEHTPEDHPPNWSMTTTSEAQAEYWRAQCFLRVRPVYLGPNVEIEPPRSGRLE